MTSNVTQCWARLLASWPPGRVSRVSDEQKQSWLDPTQPQLNQPSIVSRGLKTPVAGWHCHPEDLGPSDRFWAMVFWKPVQNMSGQFKMCPNSSKFVRTPQNMAEQPKMCPEGSRCVQTAQNMSGQPKMCPDSSIYVQTVQNWSRQLKICLDSQKSVLKCIIYFCKRRLCTFLVGRKKWLCRFLVCRGRYLRIFHPEDFWLPPGRFKPLRFNNLCFTLLSLITLWKTVSNILTDNLKYSGFWKILVAIH